MFIIPISSCCHAAAIRLEWAAEGVRHDQTLDQGTIRDAAHAEPGLAATRPTATPSSSRASPRTRASPSATSNRSSSPSRSTSSSRASAARAAATPWPGTLPGSTSGRSSTPSRAPAASSSASRSETLRAPAHLRHPRDLEGGHAPPEGLFREHHAGRPGQGLPRRNGRRPRAIEREATDPLGAMRSVLKLLGSVKLALALFILLASASALGTLIPQRTVARGISGALRRRRRRRDGAPPRPPLPVPRVSRPAPPVRGEPCRLQPDQALPQAEEGPSDKDAGLGRRGDRRPEDPGRVRPRRAVTDEAAAGRPARARRPALSRPGEGRRGPRESSGDAAASSALFGADHRPSGDPRHPRRRHRQRPRQDVGRYRPGRRRLRSDPRRRTTRSGSTASIPITIPAAASRTGRARSRSRERRPGRFGGRSRSTIP